MVSEAAARASRLLAVIILAATLSTSEYGIAMLALAWHEIVRLLNRVGTGAKVVQCESNNYLKVAGNCYSLNWLIALLVAALQFSSAPFIAQYYSSPNLAPLLKVMALSYLLYPAVAIKVALLQRDNRFRHIGLVSAAAIAGDNLTTAFLALQGFGLYSVAYAKVVAALIWCIGFYPANTPKFIPRFQPNVIASLLQFSLPVLFSDSIRTLRQQIDILLAGHILSPEYFGIYSFAKSAGVGFAISVNNAFTSAIYPRLAEAQRTNTLALQLWYVTVAAGFLCLIFVTQSFAAEIYIPLLFDAPFSSAASIVSILCLSAIPMLAADIYSLSLRVQYRLGGEFMFQLVFLSIISITLISVELNTAIDFAKTTTSISVAAILLISFIFPAKKLFSAWQNRATLS